MQEKVDHIWHETYDLLRGPSATKKFGQQKYLAPSFEEELLNAVASISKVTDLERPNVIAGVRARLGICGATNLIASPDIERIQAELDRLK